MNNSYIDIYETMYNVDLVVANKYTTIEQLNKEYSFSDDTDINKEILEGCASTCTCKRRSTGKYVLLVKFNRISKIKGIDKKSDLINTCSHEACHVALHIYEYIGAEVSITNQEPYCYLTAWITECIYKTITKK